MSYWLMVIISFVLERVTTMTLQTSVQRLQLLINLEENDAEVDLDLA